MDSQISTDKLLYLSISLPNLSFLWVKDFIDIKLTYNIIGYSDYLFSILRSCPTCIFVC